MDTIYTHLCGCGKSFGCPFCGTPERWMCPTQAKAEDGMMCEDCLDVYIGAAMARTAEEHRV